ncbi:MAG: hypothetical protein IT442_11390, partial [Phycisphaeraceae bacterium]|nr:hypothetical protein [Phycisphaeraceae bacterium]
MAGDPFKKVRPGETLTIPAAAYNAMLDAAMANRQGQAMGAGPGGGVATPTSTTVLIKNNSGVARNQFDILGLDGALFDPATALESFKRQVVLKGVVPTSDHTGKFVVLQEPARVGGIARACLLGATVARVNVTTESLTYADVLASDACGLLPKTCSICYESFNRAECPGDSRCRSDTDASVTVPSRSS